MGEVAAFAQVLTHTGTLKKIQEQVRFARARFGQYDLLDFVVVLIGYAISGEPTLQTFYERLLPFAEPFMALFERKQLPHRSTLSRFLAALDQATVEALRVLFQEDLPERHPFASAGGLWDRCLPPSSFRAGLCARLSRTQARRSGAHPHRYAPGAYPPVSGHGWRDQAMAITEENCCEPSR
jgi:hypothetical protein